MENVIETIIQCMTNFVPNEAALPFEDITAGLSLKLKPEVLKAFEYKIKHVNAEYNDFQDDGSYIRRYGSVRFFGHRCNNKVEGVIRLAEILNEQYDNFKFHGVLANVIIEMSKYVGVPSDTSRYIAISYVLLSQDDCEKFDAVLKKQGTEYLGG